MQILQGWFVEYCRYYKIIPIKHHGSYKYYKGILSFKKSFNACTNHAFPWEGFQNFDKFISEAH